MEDNQIGTQSEETLLVSYKKLIVFGYKAVGKTSLLNRLDSSSFSDSYNEKTEQFEIKRIYSKTSDRKELYLNVMNIRLSNNSLTDKELILLDDILYECQCAIFMIDVTSQESFESAKLILETIGNKNSEYPFLKKLFVANKIDKEPEVSEFEINEYITKKRDLEYLEVSLSTLKGYDDLFLKIHKALYDNDNSIPNNILFKPDNLLTKISSSEKILEPIKIALLGDSTVGKTSLINRYFSNSFSFDMMPSIGINDVRTVIKISGKYFKLIVSDTAGQEKYRSMTKHYYKNADGILLLFDVTDEKSFNNISNWMNDIYESRKIDDGKGENNEDGKGNEGNKEMEKEKIIVFLLGNKVDLIENRVIEKSRAESEAKNLGIPYYEVSCVLNLNINEVLSRLVLRCACRGELSEQNFYLNDFPDINIKEKKGCKC